MYVLIWGALPRTFAPIRPFIIHRIACKYFKGLEVQVTYDCSQTYQDKRPVRTKFFQTVHPSHLTPLRKVDLIGGVAIGSGS